MSVKIDTVYQKVLMFANKEQRGYITPQEFNMFADQAQKEIFEQYFYDLNQFSRQNISSAENADMMGILEEKINIFLKQEESSTNPERIDARTHKLVNVWAGSSNRLCEEISTEELLYIQQSPLLSPKSEHPVYTREEGLKVHVHPSDIYDKFTYQFIKTPTQPQWTYVVVNNKAMYDATNPNLNDFDLHKSEESELVYKILKFAGISMRRQDIVQNAQALENLNVQQQKQ